MANLKKPTKMKAIDQGSTTVDRNRNLRRAVKTNGKMNAKTSANQATELITHLNIFKNKDEQRQFLREYTKLPISCQNKLLGLCEIISDGNRSFKISQYMSQSDQGYEYFDFIIYHKREGIKPTRQQMPAIGLVKKLISVYYDTNSKIDLNIKDLLSHCNTILANTTSRRKKVSAKSEVTTETSK
ncbi:hypothetical protein [Sphingobacterium sp. DR205]|uniref:hypothetical protein n=1 Tax=Sphingobacterium sp. DR205 TaxID=2713573 RepID=UPI0013E4E609|nr:hypothetical protein [Sphingobacterium sp. DR205]QIH33873.1 hypothetical protein G6053_13710 [Sphingobacterium sp. DR205]